MIHAFRLSQLLARDEAKADPELGQRFDWTNRTAPGWKDILPASDADVKALIRAGVKDLKLRGFEPRRFDGEPVLLGKLAAGGNFSAALPLMTGLTLKVEGTAVRQKVVLRVACLNPVRVTVTTRSGEVVSEQTVVTGKDWQKQWSEAALELPEAGLYDVELYSPKLPLRLSVPSGVAITFPGWSSHATPIPPLYFYVPAGVSRLALHSSYVALGPPRFIDPTGQEVRPESADGGTLLLVDVPTQHRGAVWTLDRADCPPGFPLRFLNAPAAFALSPDALLIPRDALSR
jgi:hypothetical protein